jgi:hypothetical protein
LAAAHEWRSLPRLPQRARVTSATDRGARLVAVADRWVWVVDGVSQHTCAFEADTEQWLVGPDLPVSCHFTQLAAIDRRIYMAVGPRWVQHGCSLWTLDAGAWLAAAAAPSFADARLRVDGQASAPLSAADADAPAPVAGASAAGEWSRVASMPAPVMLSTAWLYVTHEQQLCVESAGRYPVRTVYVPSCGTVGELQPRPNSNDASYSRFHCHSNGDTFTFCDQARAVLVYDKVARRWREVTGDRGHGAALVLFDSAPLCTTPVNCGAFAHL